MNPTVYILQSIKDGKTYIGSTSDFDRRFREHNTGKVKSTKYRMPFKVLFVEKFKTLKETRKREKWWKNGAGRRKMKEFFQNNRKI